MKTELTTLAALLLVAAAPPDYPALLSADRIEFARGWWVRVPTAGVWEPDGQDYGDRAIEPNLRVRIDAAALCEGRDAGLERALAILSDARP